MGIINYIHCVHLVGLKLRFIILTVQHRLLCLSLASFRFHKLLRCPSLLVEIVCFFSLFFFGQEVKEQMIKDKETQRAEQRREGQHQRDKRKTIKTQNKEKRMKTHKSK